MIPLKIKNVWLVILISYYKIFKQNVDIQTPNDINEHEIVLGCLIFCFTFILLGLLITMIIGLLIIKLFII